MVSIEAQEEIQIKIEDKQELSWREIGLDLIVDLVKKREINPWDIDLVFVIDKFLSQIKNEELKQVGEIIFFVSVLLRIKSENLIDKQEESPIVDDLVNFDDFAQLGITDEIYDYGEIKDFENSENTHEIDISKIDLSDARSYVARNPKSIKNTPSRRVTLQDLINILDKLDMPKVRRKPKITLEDFGMDEIVIREDEESDIFELAHDENLEEKIKILSQYILELLEIGKETALSSLKEVFGNKIDTFLSSVFLAHDGKTEIIQKKIYDELWIRRLI